MRWLNSTLKGALWFDAHGAKPKLVQLVGLDHLVFLHLLQEEWQAVFLQCSTGFS